MKKINFEIQMASLLPEFIFQFLLNENVDHEYITCLELEDLRDAIKHVHDNELDDIKKFLFVENKTDDEEGPEAESEHDQTGGLKSIEESMGKVDEALEEVESEFYHRYTPIELKYIFTKIIDNIDKLYKLYLESTELNMALTIGFKFKNELESNLVIEFFSTGFKPEALENDTFYLPCKNAMVSDEVAVRAYFIIDPEEMESYEEYFNKITDVMNVKVDDRYKQGLN